MSLLSAGSSPRFFSWLPLAPALRFPSESTFFDPSPDFFALLAQLYQLAAHGFVFFLALLELLPYALYVALRGNPGFFAALYNSIVR